MKRRLAACEQAVIGFGTIKLGQVKEQLVLQKFNPTRELQKEVVKKMIKSMEVGDCQNSSNPLFAAVDPNLINQGALVESYDPGQPIIEPPRAEFLNPKAKIYILAGYHRVTASLQTAALLANSLNKIKEQLDKIQGDDEYDAEEEDGVSKYSLALTLKGEIKVVNQLIANVQAWPVCFYDLGKPPFPQQ